MRFKSIRTRLVVSILALVVTMIFLLQAINFVLLQNAFNKLVPISMQSSLQSAHMQIRAKLDENFATIETIAQMPNIKDTSTSLNKRAESLADYIEKNAGKGFLACAITDTSGKAVLSSGIEIDVAQDSYFKKAIEGEKIVSDPFISRATGKLLVVYAVPYKDKSGNIAGVITLDVDALHLSQDFNVEGLGQTGVAFAIAENGDTVVSNELEAVASQLNDLKSLKATQALQGLWSLKRKWWRARPATASMFTLAHQKLFTTCP